VSGNGHFISFEGGEGVGKSTQVARVGVALRERGHDVIITREPGGTPGAEAIRSLVMDGGVDRWSAAVEVLLFAAARGDHVARVIRPALDGGAWVLCDRFVDSTHAYQGGAGGIPDADITRAHAIGSGGLMPDRTILLRLPPSVGNARATNRDGSAADRFAARDADYARRLARRFDELADAEPVRFRVIDASGSVPAVTDAILMALNDLL